MRTIEKGLTIDRLREVLSYDAASGRFEWKVSKGNRRGGSIAGKMHCKGYWVIHIDGQNHLAHRLAYAISHGEWPEHQVDHKNLQRDDNRLSNLRAATTSQNRANTGGRSSYSGLKGAYRSRDKYRAYIGVNNRQRYLGVFDTPELAHAAYARAAGEIFGAFAKTE